MKKILITLILLFSTLAVAQVVKIPVAIDFKDTKTQSRLETMDLNKPAELLRFTETIDKLLELSDRQKKEKKEIGDAYQEPPFYISKDKREALKEVKRLLSEPQKTPSLWANTLELTAAFKNAFRFPIRKNYDVIELPIIFVSSVANPVIMDYGDSSREARNLEEAPKGIAKGLVNPVASSFWKPSAVSEKNMYVGFNRSVTPDVSEICQYSAPKTGYGSHAGFHVKCNGADVKLRLGEEKNSTPFISRVFWALGYNATPMDYVAAMKVTYDRRLLLEFNTRKESGMNLNILKFITIKKVPIQHYINPFESIQEVTLKSGQKLSADEFKAKLLRDTSLKAEVNPANYNEDFERTINYITMVPASMAYDSDKNISVGPWDWNEFDHPNRRELRGVYILAAWLGAYDLRWENTRLELTKTGDGLEMRHVFSDLGSGLGRSGSVLSFFAAVANDFTWEITSREVSSPPHGRNLLLLPGFNMYMGNKAFAHTTFEDARWMVRRFAQFSKDQLTQALVVSGFSAAEVKLYVEKLLSRRNKIIQDLNLENELPLAETADRHFSFDPLQTPVKILTPDGQTIVAPDRDLVIRNGRVESRNAND
jgi:hypothetical protein